MIERQKRLKEVYDHLRKYFGVHTQIDFAEAIKYSRPVISSALNGNEDYLTDKLFKTINDAFPGTFNLEYLLNGNGDLLTIEEEVKSEELGRAVNQPAPPSAFEYSFAHETIAVLRQQVADKDVQIADLRADKERLIKETDAKSKTIDSLQARIHELEAYIKNIATSDPLHGYPFTVGVADRGESEPTRV